MFWQDSQGGSNWGSRSVGDAEMLGKNGLAQQNHVLPVLGGSRI